MPTIFEFANSDTTFLIFIAAILIVISAWNAYIYINLAKIKKKSRIFFEGKEAKDLEEIIFNQIKNTNEAKANMEKLFAENKEISEKLNNCVQKFSVVRFNPFSEVGSNQSFVAAFLDNRLNGVIIMSLYAREGVRIYAKSVKEGKSEYRLSKEEEEAIKLASREL